MQEKPVRFHFPREKPGCKGGMLSWANENTCCALCFWRRKFRQLKALARLSRKDEAKRVPKHGSREFKPGSSEFEMSLHGVPEDQRDEAWHGGTKGGKKEGAKDNSPRTGEEAFDQLYHGGRKENSGR